MEDNNMDFNQLLGMLDSGDLIENINRIGLLMGNLEKGEAIKNLVKNFMDDKSQEIENLSTRMSHTDPAINLLLALKPYLSENRQNLMDDALKTFNMSFFIRQLHDMA